MRRSNGHPIVHVSDGGNSNSAVNDVSHMNVNSGVIDSLPKEFVDLMKTLFDIMDDQKAGYVNLSDIEKGWQDDGSKGLPCGVIDSLRKVTPLNGLLSFERFCTGLKICLLRNQTEEKYCGLGLVANKNSLSSNDKNGKSARPPSAPLLDVDKQILSSQWFSNNTVSIRPNNAIQCQRALSLPQLSPFSDIDLTLVKISNKLYGAPPKPPRSAMITPSKVGFDKAEIRNALQNWQMGMLMSEMDIKGGKKIALPGLSANRMTLRGTGDGGSTADPSCHTPNQKMYSKDTVNNKIREPRRHTLQNGIDNNLLKRLKQFEAEKDFLIQGLSALEQAREWYLKQIAIIQEKIKFLGNSGWQMEQWSEAHQERLDFQRARVLEINRHLSALQFSWERGGLPSHMNLAVPYRSNRYSLTQGNAYISHLQT